MVITVRVSKTPFTHAWSCRGCDQKGPPMIHPEPVSGHCWGTVGPCPGANLKPLPFGDCTVHSWGLVKSLGLRDRLPEAPCLAATLMQHRSTYPCKAPKHLFHPWLTWLEQQLHAASLASHAQEPVKREYLW